MSQQPIIPDAKQIAQLYSLKPYLDTQIIPFLKQVSKEIKENAKSKTAIEIIFPSPSESPIKEISLSSYKKLIIANIVNAFGINGYKVIIYPDETKACISWQHEFGLAEISKCEEIINSHKGK